MKRPTWCAPALLLVTMTATTAAAEPTPLEAKAREVCSYLKPDPAGLETLFNATFIGAVGKDRLLETTRRTTASTGACTAATVTQAASPTRGQVAFTMAKGMTLPADLSVEAQDPHLINGLRLKPPVSEVKSLDEAVAKLAALPGAKSLLVMPLDAGAPLAVLDEEKPLAIASAFKLFILAELGRQVAAGKHKLADVAVLRDEQRSFASAFLEKWPRDAPLTLHTIATMMISKSDNTAADLLLSTLGVASVEAGLAASGDRHPDGMRPFMTTVQAFQLKLLVDDATRERWGKGNAAEKRKILASLHQPLSEVTRSPGDKPLDIEHIEWFASAGDLCRVMATLRGQKPLRDVLAVNTGIPIDPARWPFAGFKGGSEAGVLSAAYLLEDRNGKATCVAAIWNDPDKAVDQPAFTSILGGLIQALPN